MRRNVIPTSDSLRRGAGTARPCSRKTGWALPEVIVVAGVASLVVILGWLIWLSAVQQSRREGMKENLRTMGQGIRVYYDSWRSFPSGGAGRNTPAGDHPLPDLPATSPGIVDEAEESIWFDPETGELKRGWYALLAAGGAACVVVVTLAGVALTHLKSS